LYAVLARREASSEPAGWKGRYINHLYFSYVALWVGFLIVPAINSPASDAPEFIEKVGHVVRRLGTR
jgi:hypothetical protein